MMITKNELKAAIDNVDDQYLYIVYQLIQKLSPQQKRNITHQYNFKTFLLNIPKIEELAIERQRDYPKDLLF